MKLLIKQYRKKRKLTEKQLAAMVDISQGYLNKIEKGLKTPSLQTLEKLAKALKVHPFRLVLFDMNCKQDKTKHKSKKSTPE